jgi:hypothetical protein
MAATNRHTCMTYMMQVSHTSHTFHTKIRVKSEHPAKIMPPNSYAEKWIRISSYGINDMRTVSAQTVDSKWS